MTKDEARGILGVGSEASVDEIKAAFRQRAKEAHPDLNGHDPGAEARFRLVREAYEILLGKQQPGSEELFGQDASSFDDEAEAAQAARPDPVGVVREFMAREQVVVLFDGTLRVGAGLRTASGPADVESCLSQPIDFTDEWLIDCVVHEVRRDQVELTKGDIERAWRMILHEDRPLRRKAIVAPLMTSELTQADRVRADAEWTRLLEGAFKIDVQLGCAVLQHFIWQVKQKLVRRSARHHLMPIIWDPLQGGGKTTFVLKFLGPLEELVAGPALLSDFADRRSGDIYQYPVVFIDDVERIDPALVPQLKSLVTSDGFQRRRLGTSRTRKVRQQATLIGTANEGIERLIADDTGHRRFFALPLKNGAIATGGDPDVWPLIDSADYALLWRSVNTFAPSPIEAVLDQLARAQAAARPEDPLVAWLCALDLDSQEVLGISTRDGVRADGLRELYCQQTGNVVNKTKFGLEMKRHVLDSRIPLGPKVEKCYGTVYPIKNTELGAAPPT